MVEIPFQNNMNFCKTCGVELIKGVNWKTTNFYCRVHLNEYMNKYYHQNHSKCIGYRKKYESKHNKTPERRKQLNDIARKNMEKHPEKWVARAMVRRAVKMGELAKLACEKCGNFLSEAHHPDYSQPLNIWWLCKKHHVMADRGELKLYE